MCRNITAVVEVVVRHPVTCQQIRMLAFKLLKNKKRKQNKQIICCVRGFQIWAISSQRFPFLFVGMVSVCAGCNDFKPWAALLVGAVGGVAFIGWHYLMVKIKVDDPLDAVAGRIWRHFQRFLIMSLYALSLYQKKEKLCCTVHLFGEFQTKIEYC